MNYSIIFTEISFFPENSSLSEKAPCGRLEVDKTLIEGHHGYDLGASLCGARRGYICQHQGIV